MSPRGSVAGPAPGPARGKILDAREVRSAAFENAKSLIAAASSLPKEEREELMLMIRDSKADESWLAVREAKEDAPEPSHGGANGGGAVGGHGHGPVAAVSKVRETSNAVLAGLLTGVLVVGFSCVNSTLVFGIVERLLPFLP